MDPLFPHLVQPQHHNVSLTKTSKVPIQEIDQLLKELHSQHEHFRQADENSKKDIVLDFYENSLATVVDEKEQEKTILLMQGMQNIFSDKASLLLPFLRHALMHVNEKNTQDAQLFTKYVQQQFAHEIEKNVLSEFQFLAHILDRNLLQSQELMEELFGREMLSKEQFQKQSYERAMRKRSKTILVDNLKNALRASHEFQNAISQAEEYNMLQPNLPLLEKIAQMKNLISDGSLQTRVTLKQEDILSLKEEMQQIEFHANKLNELEIDEEKSTQNYEMTLKTLVNAMQGVLHDDPHQQKSVFEHMSSLLKYLELDPKNTEHRESVHKLFSVATHHYKESGAREQNLLMQLQVALEYLENKVEEMKTQHNVEIEVKCTFTTMPGSKDLSGFLLHIDAWKDGKCITTGEVVNSTSEIFEVLMGKRKQSQVVEYA